MNNLSTLTEVKRAIDMVSGYLSQPELDVTAYGVEHSDMSTQTKITVKIDENTSITVYLSTYKEEKK